MDIEFKTSENARKLLYVYGLKLALSPMYKEIVADVADDKSPPNLKFEEFLQSDVDVPLDVTDPRMRLEADQDFFTNIETGVEVEFKKCGAELDRQMPKMLGFPAPKKLVVVLAEDPNPGGSRGTSFPSRYEDTALIGMIIGKDWSSEKGLARNSKTITCAMIHEMLHSRLFRYEFIDYNKHKNDACDTFGEVLLEYFAPIGILTQEIGLLKEMPVRKYHEINTRNRPELTQTSEDLLSSIEKYSRDLHSKDLSGQTIWEFLKRTDDKESGKFKEFINLEPLNDLKPPKTKSRNV
jgi:hypothetical protein